MGGTLMTYYLPSSSLTYIVIHIPSHYASLWAMFLLAFLAILHLLNHASHHVQVKPASWWYDQTIEVSSAMQLLQAAHTLPLGLKVKVCFLIAQYPVRWTAQSALHFTPSRPVHSDANSNFLGSVLAAITREDYSLKFPPLPIAARYSFIQLSELGHRGENENAQALKK